MSQLIYKCIDPRICGLLESGEHTYILRNSNLGKVFVNTEYEGLSNNNKYHNYFDNEFISLNSGQKEFFCNYEECKDYFKIFIDMKDYKTVSPDISKNHYDKSDTVIINVCKSEYCNKIMLVKRGCKYSLIGELEDQIEVFRAWRYDLIDLHFLKNVANRKFNILSERFNVDYSDDILDIVVEISNDILNSIDHIDSLIKNIKLKGDKIADLVGKII